MFDPELNLESLALRQHARWCRRNGVTFDQPSAIDVTEDSVLLSNVRGVIANFTIVERDRVVRLRRADPCDDDE
jgi:hypothetical protein